MKNASNDSNLNSKFMTLPNGEKLFLNKEYSIKSVSGEGFLDGRNKSYNNPLLTHRPVDNYLKWTFGPIFNNDQFAIKSVSSGNYLDGRKPGYSNPLVTNRNPDKNDYPLLWKIIPHKDKKGVYFLKSVGSGLYLDGRNKSLKDPLMTDRDPYFSQGEYLWWNLKIEEPGIPFRNNFLFFNTDYSLQSYTGKGYLDGRNKQYNNPVLTHRKVDTFLLWRFLKVANSPFITIKSNSSQNYLDGRAKGYTNPLVTDRTPNEKDTALLWNIEQHKTNDNVFFLKSIGSTAYLDGRNEHYKDPVLTVRDPYSSNGGQFLWWLIETN